MNKVTLISHNHSIAWLNLLSWVFHKAKRLNIPDNIKLVFLPPYSPELNPAEKMWAKFKRGFTNKLFHSLEQISQFIDNVIKTIDKQMIISICAYKDIFLTLSGMNYNSPWCYFNKLTSVHILQISEKISIFTVF